MEKLKEAYIALNPDVEIEVQQSDSTTGVNSAIEGICDIGMASRELKDSELEQGITGTVIALDGIAVVINPENTVEDLTIEQIAGLADGTIKNWSEVGGPDAEVVLIGREAGSGTRDGFELSLIHI